MKETDLTVNNYNIEVDDEYDVLICAIKALLGRVSHGKGKQRHQEFVGQPFMQQQICRLSSGYRLGQIQKKAFECSRLRKPQAADECLDIAAYALAEWLVIQEELRLLKEEREVSIKF
jgi:hypothetical protein